MDTDSLVYIYGLVDPETNEVRYIGKSIRPEGRLRDHINEPPSNCHRSHWIQSLKARGLEPSLMIIETVHGEWPWQESERFWIKRCRDGGMRLTNNTSGGDGVCGLPPETKERMRQTWLGRKHRPETIEKLRVASSSRTASDATRKKMSKSQTGRRILWVDKVAESLRKLSLQAETIKQRLDRGEKVTSLAIEFKVHRTTISKIKKGTYFERYRKSAGPTIG